MKPVNLSVRTYLREFTTCTNSPAWRFRWKENSVLSHEVLVKEQYLAFMFEKLLKEAGYSPVKGGKDV